MTFASPQPPKQITAGYLRVPVEPCIPNPLRCFNNQKYAIARGLARALLCVCTVGKLAMRQPNAKIKTRASIASSRECPKWNLENRVQQIKVERGISFPGARKAALSEQSAYTSFKRTADSILSSATTITSKVTKKNTSPEGTDSPVSVKHNDKSQTTQTYKKLDNTKPGNPTSPSPPPRTSKAGNAATSSTGEGGQGDPHPRPSTSKSAKKNAKPRINRPLHIQITRSLFSRYGVLDVEGGGRLGRRVAPESCFYHVCFYPMEHAWSASQPRGA